MARISWSRTRDDILKNIDVILLLGVFLYLYMRSLEYPEMARRFPATFLLVGIIALVIEFTTNVLLPMNYRETIRRYTAGITENLEDSIIEDVETESQEERLSNLPGVTFNKHLRVIILASTIVIYGVVTYVIGYIYSSMLFIPAIIFLVGSQRKGLAVVLTALVIGAMLVLFGELMNVPIFERGAF